ncbi:MAG: NAD-dependent deacylase [Saprospiraceae bacterium]|nr:NAD-dependent deacylase [Saprospiraceae bacterium]
MVKKIVVLSGAGISAESGIQTFRDAGGLWEGHDVMEVASPAGWRKNKKLVLDFYNQRRQQLKEVQPNLAHYAIKELEDKYEVVVVTQNIDDLHERAGSSHIIHLHGELRKVRSVDNELLITYTEEDVHVGDLATDGFQLRPHIVWFGEMVPMMDKAAEQVQNADIVIIVGTSMQVYPAAGLIAYASTAKQIYYVDPKPNLSYELRNQKGLEVIEEKATIGIENLKNLLMKH